MMMMMKKVIMKVMMKVILYEIYSSFVRNDITVQNHSSQILWQILWQTSRFVLVSMLTIMTMILNTEEHCHHYHNISFLTKPNQAMKGCIMFTAG